MKQTTNLADGNFSGGLGVKGGSGKTMHDTFSQPLVKNGHLYLHFRSRTF